MKAQTNEKSQKINNTLESLPDVIDKDMGWFLMFGEPDENTTRTSTNYDAVMAVPKFR